MLLLLLLSTGARAGEGPTHADLAFEAGDHDRALELYDVALAERPHDTRVLMRSAQLLSWERRFDEALDRYDRLLAVEPDNRDAAFERAKVLSWDRRYGEAVVALRGLLAERPDETPVRLALARTLAWKGDYSAARAEFAAVLAAHPEEPAALVGTAQTYAWSGRLHQARSWYERALRGSPDDRDATLGLAYVELWSGELRAADALAGELAERHPDHEEVAALVRRTGRAVGPSLRLAADRLDDTDDNRLEVYRVDAGWRLGGSAGLTLDAARYELSDPTNDARIDSFGATLDLRPAVGQRVTLRAGADRSRHTDGASETVVLGGVRYTHGIGHPWEWSLAATRDALRYSPTITDNDIVVDELRAALEGRVGDRWRVLLGADRGEFSDDNRRNGVQGGFAYRLRTGRPRLETGLELRWMDYSEDLDNGYFDPQRFRSQIARLRGGGTLGNDRTRYGFDVGLGLQSFTRGGVETEDDTVVLLMGTLDFPLSRSTELQLFAGWGDYAAQTAAGFESRQLGLRLRWSGGS